MTRKDFKLIASAIEELRWDGEIGAKALDIVSRRLAHKLAKTWDDHNRFLKACGVND